MNAKATSRDPRHLRPATHRRDGRRDDTPAVPRVDSSRRSDGIRCFLRCSNSILRRPTARSCNNYYFSSADRNEHEYLRFQGRPQFQRSSRLSSATAAATRTSFRTARCRSRPMAALATTTWIPATAWSPATQNAGPGPTTNCGSGSRVCSTRSTSLTTSRCSTSSALKGIPKTNLARPTITG